MNSMDVNSRRSMYPLKMGPVFKDYIWGGTCLIDNYGKETDLPLIAESWEVSCHPDGQSTVENGSLSGQTLTRVLERYPGWMGRRCGKMTEFPLLIKLIDARQPLSLQVHPDDEYARRVERQAGKNEMWYVVDAKPGAELILGFKEPLRRPDIEALITRRELISAVRKIPVQSGDCYCIPAGMLHAIGGGIFIIEVQQTSNVTYRVYDYERKGPDGNDRELHIDKALDVLDATLQAQKATGNTLADWPFFRCELIAVDGGFQNHCGHESFQCLIVIDGELSVAWDDGALLLKKGETAFIPAGMGNNLLKGPAKVILVSMKESF